MQFLAHQIWIELRECNQILFETKSKQQYNEQLHEHTGRQTVRGRMKKAPPEICNSCGLFAAGISIFQSNYHNFVCVFFPLIRKTIWSQLI